MRAKLFGLLIATLCLPVHAAKDQSPNFLFILVDDLAWNDLASYGHKFFQTPHLDRLAADGIRFTQAYAPAPICSASRAAILTGKTPARLGFEFVTKPKPGGQSSDLPLQTPPYTLNLPLSETTIAEALKAKSYHTAFLGKWHLNQHYKGYLGWSPTHGPQQQGFDHTVESFGSHPYSYRKTSDPKGVLDLPTGIFPKDTLTEEALKFLKRKHTRPFFLLLSHYYVHTPINTRVRWLHDKVLASIPADHPRRDNLAHYGAMVTTLDHHVGKILTALESSGLSKSTTVVFTSDNGADPNFSGNAPHRGSKWNLYEGGIRVPLIVRLPKKRHAGTVCEAPVCGTDLLPTFLDLAKLPASKNIDGQSLAPFLDNPRLSPPPRILVWHFPYYHPETKFAEHSAMIGIDDGHTTQTRPHSAIRSDSYKLIYFDEDKRSELYHLPSDPTEQNNLAESQPEKTAALRKALEDYLKSVSARRAQARQ